ncbi:MAG: M15 family metallopeptidase [Pseudomonadales bacterium]|nr:M15 family metallopeptidase [Pseudomonadales bacterium]
MGRFTNLGYCIGMILILQSCSSDQSEQTEAVIPVFYEVNSFLSDEVQPIQTDVRYFSADNFVGEVITGYNAEKILMTLEAALALAAIQIELGERGLGLKVFDAYRPQQAVDDFARWAEDINDTSTKAEYYPNIAKQDLFSLGYIAAQSGHSRGSTVDLTLVELITGDELDMGAPWDLFDPISWPTSLEVSLPQKTNREILREIMLRYGFNPLREEWWHFTLDDEPFPDTYFDFPIN